MFDIGLILNIISLQIGLENLKLNQQQVDGLMDEMKGEQNKMLKQIIEQNQEIIKLLKESLAK